MDLAARIAPSEVITVIGGIGGIGGADGTVVSDLEPCAAFAPGPDGDPVCSTCGWLDDEHDVTARTVVDLRGRQRGSGDVRLAS